MVSRRFDPRRSFRTPRSVRSQLTIRPRVIADDIWAKLLWAGLNVTANDLPVVYWSEGDRRRKNRKQCPLYPLELVQAVTVVWLFAGLRSDEIAACGLVVSGGSTKANASQPRRWSQTRRSAGSTSR
jgi:hypothetical protein